MFGFQHLWKPSYLPFIQRSFKIYMKINFKYTKEVGVIFNSSVLFKNLIFELKIQISTTSIFSKSQTVEMKDVAVRRV